MDAAHTAFRWGTFIFSLGMVAVGEAEMQVQGEEGTIRKATLREQLAVKRKAMSADLIDARGLKVQARFLATPYYHRSRTVALYAPIRGEVPTRDILTAALADGKTVCYPLSHVHGRILSFRAITSETELEPGRLGVREPTSVSDLVPVEQIDLFVVPGLGFTKDGKRLGRGGGYYDATLSAASPHSRRVGLAFSDQIVDMIPTTSEDVDMDLIVTEGETYKGVYREPESLDT